MQKIKIICKAYEMDQKIHRAFMLLKLQQVEQMQLKRAGLLKEDNKKDESN